jgi:hypothetical protein
MGRIVRGGLVVLVASVLASCATLGKEAPCPSEVLAPGSGPAVGSKLTQEITSTADIVWRGRDAAKGPYQVRRETGIRLKVVYEVVSRSNSSVALRASISRMEIIQDGAFVNAPFMSLGPPTLLSFSIDYATGQADFTEAEKAYAAWAEGFGGTPVGDILSASFDVGAFAAQLKDLLGRPAQEYARFAAGAAGGSVRGTMSMPFLGPGLALGPMEIERRVTLLPRVKEGGHALLPVEEKTLSVAPLRLSPEELAGRFAHLGLNPPEACQGEGAFGGETSARVDASTGWVRSQVSSFRSTFTCRHAAGELTEEIIGKRLVTTR